jgi:asparagine synthase (glutamine-hydrolysing)
MGIKPLYICELPEGLAFASEVRALIAAGLIEPALDPVGAELFMAYGYVPGPYSLFAGVRKLMPGTALVYEGGAITHQASYWNPWDEIPQRSRGASWEEDTERLLELLRRSVREHMISDVPLGLMLSGGVDSSFVGALMAQESRNPIKTFSIGFAGRPESNELAAARQVATRIGSDHHELIVDMRDDPSAIEDMLWKIEEPITDLSALGFQLISALAREEVTVALSGQGADELFGGYRKHLACQLASNYSRMPGLPRAAVRAGVGALPVSLGGRGLRTVRWAKRFLTFAELPEEPRFRRSYTLYDGAELAGLISPDLGHYVDEIIGEHAAIYTDNALPDQVNRMCLAVARLFLPGLNLSYTDRSSMAASVEVRVPFVDPVVARAAFSFTGADKIRRRQGKVALKQAAERWLPQEIVHRPKASFSAPLRSWVRGDLHEMIQDVLVRGELTGAGVLRREALTRLIADDQAGREDRSKQIWQLLTLELWYRHAQSAGVAA